MAAVAHEARVRGRRRPLSRKLGAAGPFTYLFLIVVAILSLFPLYWSLVVASHDNSAISAYPPVLTPGNQLWHNVSRRPWPGYRRWPAPFWHSRANPRRCPRPCSGCL